MPKEQAGEAVGISLFSVDALVLEPPPYAPGVKLLQYRVEECVRNAAGLPFPGEYSRLE
jgi:hypothetical protein